MRRFDNYRSNLEVLTTADRQDLTNAFIVGGIIDKFYIQFELGWKVLKELLVYEGVTAARTGSPRQIVKEAYRFYTCIDEEIWLGMLSERNNMAHLYDGQAARRLAETIIEAYIPAFLALKESVEDRYKDVLDRMA
jgi:nucleotidyltransferase substrate binding protein (TIGR01987 family)